MTSMATKVLEDALRLSEQDRADVAALLIDSLDPEEEQDVESAWRAEVQRRLHELEQGTAKLIPWSEARQIIMGTHNDPH
jgi:putative addiction module component (TIGR02574 family)